MGMGRFPAAGAAGGDRGAGGGESGVDRATGGDGGGGAGARRCSTAGSAWPDGSRAG